MMEMKNEMAAEREVFHREKDKWMHQMKRLQYKYEQEKNEFERQKYILTVSLKVIPSDCLLLKNTLVSFLERK